MLVPQEPSPERRPMLRDLNRDGTRESLDQPTSALSNNLDTTPKVRRLGAWAVAGDLPASFRYAAQGLIYSFRSQRNFRIHVVTGAVVFFLAIGRRFHPLARIAKDCAAAAVLVAAISSLVIAVLLLLPPLLARLGV
jgi:diacylglycerol kinase (ATP)